MEAALVLDMAAIVYHHAERGTSRFGLEEDISSAQSYPVIAKGGLTEASEGVSWSSIQCNLIVSFPANNTWSPPGTSTSKCLHYDLDCTSTLVHLHRHCHLTALSITQPPGRDVYIVLDPLRISRQMFLRTPAHSWSATRFGAWPLGGLRWVLLS
jgi:hypothetical protein